MNYGIPPSGIVLAKGLSPDPVYQCLLVAFALKGLAARVEEASLVHVCTNAFLLGGYHDQIFL